MTHIIFLTLFSLSTILFSSETNLGQKIPSAKPDTEFVIIVPSFNNAAFVEKNLSSILSQDYPLYRIIYIDDASTDTTLEKVKELVIRYQTEKKFTLIHNEENQGAMANIYKAVTTCDPKEVVCLVDGDDWLKDNTVLSILNAYYANDDVWMTYGQFEHFPSGKIGRCASFDLTDLTQQNTRKLEWRSTHMKTFYAGLFQQIALKDLMVQGKFLETTSDFAMMFPMLDMAATHAVFIPEILYVYNNQNPISIHRIRHLKQRYFASYIRDKENYPLLLTHPKHLTSKND